MKRGAAMVEPKLDALELAILHRGPQLAITIAAARLHRVGALTADVAGNTVGPAGAPAEHDDAVSELELELYDAVRRAPGIAARSLCRQLEEGEAVKRMIAQLTACGLLSEPARRPRAVVATARPTATTSGEALLSARRDPRQHPRHDDILMPVALFGAAALWAIDPILATAWTITREPFSPARRANMWVSRAICAAGLLALLAVLDFSLPLAAWVAFFGFAAGLLTNPPEFLQAVLSCLAGFGGDTLTEGYSKHFPNRWGEGG